MERTTLVSSSPGNANTLPLADAITDRTDIQSEPNSDHASSSCMAHLRKRYRDQQLSDDDIALLLNSWRAKTNKSYDSLFGRWHRWCSERSFDPFSGPIKNIANFLAHLYKEGYQYSSINAYRSAISSVHEKIDEQDVGQRPLVSRLIKGVFQARPPLPRYSSTWNVQRVLNYIESLGDNDKLSLKLLSLKLTMLLVLTRPTRSADLSQLSIS